MIGMIGRLVDKTQVIAAKRVIFPLQRKCISSGSMCQILNNVTYSGGHPTTGQGGFYGSGGSRASSVQDYKPGYGAVALVEDVNELVDIMEQVERLESELLMNGTVVNSKSIRIRSQLKKLLTSPSTTKLMKKLELGGEPVWGLCQRERALVKSAREAINSC